MGARARGWKVYGDRAVGHHIISQQRLCDTLITDTQMGHSVSMGNTDTDPALICGDGSKECLMEQRMWREFICRFLRVKLVTTATTVYLQSMLRSWLQNSTAGQTVAVWCRHYIKVSAAWHFITTISHCCCSTGVWSHWSPVPCPLSLQHNRQYL